MLLSCHHDHAYLSGNDGISWPLALRLVEDQSTTEFPAASVHSQFHLAVGVKLHYLRYIWEHKSFTWKGTTIPEAMGCWETSISTLLKIISALYIKPNARPACVHPGQKRWMVMDPSRFGRLWRSSWWSEHVKSVRVCSRVMTGRLSSFPYDWIRTANLNKKEACLQGNIPASLFLAIARVIHKRIRYLQRV